MILIKEIIHQHYSSNYAKFFTRNQIKLIYIIGISKQHYNYNIIYHMSGCIFAKCKRQHLETLYEENVFLDKFGNDIKTCETKK